MSRLKEFDYSNRAVYITANIYKRLPLLTNEHRINMIYESMAEVYPRYNFKINGFVIMPDHLHLILVSQSNDLSDIMHDIKGNIASEMFKKEHFQSKDPILQRSFYDHVIRNEKDLIEKLNYIHSNPLRAGLVRDLSEYKHSSFKYYYEEKLETPIWFQKIGVL